MKRNAQLFAAALKILMVHPVMELQGGGERLCCETIRALVSFGHEITLLTESFDSKRIEAFFGYDGLFDKVELLEYPKGKSSYAFGTTSHIIQHVRGQAQVLGKLGPSRRKSFNLVFSTQDVGYAPDCVVPLLQWGYFPRNFGSYSWRMFGRKLRNLPLQLYYKGKIPRVALVLAISEYSKEHLDKEWSRPSTLVYPACNMVEASRKRDLVVTVARASPVKRLELFWKIARQRPQYEFAMLITKDPMFEDYSLLLSRDSPINGKVMFNPPVELYHQFLQEAKVYLHFMEGEHFGITIVEAMSASCVPVVHDSGGPREIVDPRVGFRWKRLEDIPFMVDEAMRIAPSRAAKERAKEFNHARFEKRLSSIFSEFE